MKVTEDPHFYDLEIRRLQKRIEKRQNREKLVVFYGSSSLRLWVHMKEDLSPMNTLNLGFGGSSFLWCMHHFNTLFEGLAPHEIVLYAGDNDLGSGVEKEELPTRFRKLREQIRSKYPRTPIHFISIKPSPARDYLIPAIKWVNGEIEKEIEKDASMRFINIFDPMLEGHHPNTAYYLSDLLHLNRRGYEVWKKVLREHFQLDSDAALSTS